MELAYRSPLTVLIDKTGEEAFQNAVISEVLEKNSPREIANKLGVSYASLWTWITEDEDRYKAYQSALVGIADDLAHEMLDISDNPSESSAADKLRVETRMKLASKWDRARYGEQTQVQVGGSVSLIALLASLPNGTETIEGEAVDGRDP